MSKLFTKQWAHLPQPLLLGKHSVYIKSDWGISACCLIAHVGVMLSMVCLVKKRAVVMVVFWNLFQRRLYVALKVGQMGMTGAGIKKNTSRRLHYLLKGLPSMSSGFRAINRLTKVITFLIEAAQHVFLKVLSSLWFRDMITKDCRFPLASGQQPCMQSEGAGRHLCHISQDLCIQQTAVGLLRWPNFTQLIVSWGSNKIKV